MLSPGISYSNAINTPVSFSNSHVEKRVNHVTTEVEQANFNTADKILVVDGEAQVVFQFDGTKWVPNNKYLLWNAKNKSFDAHCPIDENGVAIHYVDDDQSSLDKITMSDLMYSTIESTSTDKALNYVMQRNTSRIIVKVAVMTPKFPAENKVTDVRIVAYDNALTYSSPHPFYVHYNPYPQGDGSVGSTYTLLANNNMSVMYVILKVGGKEMRTAILAEVESGKSYTFNLHVGKQIVEVESIVVKGWANTEDITGCQTKASNPIYSQRFITPIYN